MPGVVRIDGQEYDKASLQQNKDYPIQIGVRCFYIRHSSWSANLILICFLSVKETMPFQHIFTSAQIGLSPDSSGYCTVAQTEGIPDDLVKALERLSTYDFSAKSDPHMDGHSPVVYRYQFVRVHSGTFFVISKFNDAGHSNYLAQHLALDSSEISQLQDYPHLNPAFFLLAGKHWKKAWDEIPQMLPELDFESLVPGSNKETPHFVEGTCENWKNGLLGGQVD